MSQRTPSPLRKTYWEQRAFVGLLFGGIAFLMARADGSDLDGSLKIAIVVGAVCAALGFRVFSLMVGAFAVEEAGRLGPFLH